MKKILFASTALVAFAGAASAEVLLTGSAEMGLQVGDGGVAATDGDVEFFTDLDVTFTMSGETDTGLTYGASVDLDEGGDGSLVENDRTEGGETIFISGAFGTLTAGDTDGAIDWALTEVNFNSGSINDDETEHAGFNGNDGLDAIYDGQIVRYDYSVGDFGIALSAEIDDDDGDDLTVDGERDPVLGIGARYSLDFAGISGLGIGLGYQKADDAEAIGASLNGTIYGFNLGVSYINYDDTLVSEAGTGSFEAEDHIGVGVGYVTGAISLNANYGVWDIEGSDDNVSGYGLSAGYDLGGGAAVQLGYGNSNIDDIAGAEDFDTFSFGVRMSF